MLLYVKQLKKIELDNKPIVIYKDKYRNQLHIADISEMILSLGLFGMYYEDFSSKDIIKSFNTFKEAAQYVLNNKLKVTDSTYWINSAADGNEDSAKLQTPDKFDVEHIKDMLYKCLSNCNMDVNVIE